MIPLKMTKHGSSARRIEKVPQTTSKLMMVLDALKPVTYLLEKLVVRTMIPDVSTIPNRKLLKDHKSVSKKDDTTTTTFDHSKWDAVLKRHVKKNKTLGSIQNVSVVDYAGVTSDDDYDAYLQSLADAKPDELSPAAEQLAFWMNAYNALCINVIVSHEQKEGNEPLKSINNLSTRKTPVWDMAAGQIDGKDISLNEIEHVKLREQWDEPAVHGCIVCASASCPNLRDEAFVAERLGEQMEEQMRDWLSNPTKGLLREGNRLTLSRIFLWFEKDFGGWSGIQDWVPQFVDNGEAIQQENKLTKRYFEYDWSINRLQRD